MSVSAELGHSNLHTPRSLVSTSTDSSQRGSLKQVLPEKQSEPPTPNSPQHRLTRKRAASLDTDAANGPHIGDLALNSARLTETSSDSTKEQVCLCQPDPKIPRPRNAFILYRQHYQAQVVAQHPGLANPEISKIIGEQWREQAPEIKNDWKRLAEEEKQRHQRQYPGYRYQPRRAGKSNGIWPASSSSADDPVRCPKCGGRYISTPGTPLTPFTPAFGTLRPERSLPLFIQSHTGQFEKPRLPTQMQNTRMDTSRHPAPFQQQMHRRQYGPPQPLQTHRERDEDMDLLTPSSGQKRCRFSEDNNHRGYVANSPVSYSAQPFARNVAPPMSASYRQQLPGPSMLVKPESTGPPPSQYSPIVQHPRQQYPHRQSAMDESLRLPPIQTQISNGAPGNSQRPDPRAESRESQAKSIEAMVMTIPYINKIKVLTKISPPLAQPGPASPAREIRGAVIAVEGSDKELLNEIGSFITDYLSKDPSFAVRVWGSASSPPPLKPATTQPTDTEMADTSSTAVTVKATETTDEVDSFVEYLSIISEWHKKSDEMSKYITSSPKPVPAETHADATPAPKPKILPVALVPTGFSLTTSDTFALRIPINDSYAPVDHWQWMATLWRGIVGPNLTIYVTRVGPDEMNRLGGVEIRSDCGAIIVRIAEAGKMDEKTARRLGFEVVEIVRNIESGFGRS